MQMVVVLVRRGEKRRRGIRKIGAEWKLSFLMLRVIEGSFSSTTWKRKHHSPYQVMSASILSCTSNLSSLAQQRAIILPLSPPPLPLRPSDSHSHPVVPPILCPIAVLSPASETAGAFEVFRRTVQLLDGESPEEARARLDLDAREAAWLAAGGDVGCQAVVAGGLLPPAEGQDGGDGGGRCAVGHLVGAGQVFNAEEGTGERETERAHGGKKINNTD